MTIFGGVLLFVVGVVTGGSMVAYNNYSVRQATAKLAKENAQLRDAVWDARMDTQIKKAYKEGYKIGNTQGDARA